MIERLGRINMLSTIVTIGIFISSVLCTVEGNGPVPVLIWNLNQAQVDVPAVSPLEVVSYETFHDEYLASFKPNNILLFLQDALSIEDLSSHASEMHTVKEWMASGRSIYLPNVEDAARLADDLPAHGYNVVLLEPGSKTAGLELKQDKNLVVVRLPSTITNPSHQEAMQKINEVMQHVISKIGDQHDFTVVYTGLKPSVDDDTEQFVERIRVARSLKADATEKTKSLVAPIPEREGFHYGNCSMVLLRNNITISAISNSTHPPTPIEIPESKASSDKGTCLPDSTSLQMTYKDVMINETLTSEVQVTINCKIASGSWMLDSINYFDSTSGINTLYKPFNSDVSGIPVTMSYSCSQKVVLRAVNQTAMQMEMVIDGIQIQAKPTEISPARFDGAWDCVGFFTIPIWCGLLTTFLLLFILSFGMVMLADIKTMDRFDDPKGKPIMVTGAAE